MEKIDSNKTPLISVVIPIYNAQKYLEKCIKSIINQTYSNLEIILVNDGSTDQSLSICKELKSTDARILIIDIPNGGVSNARNTGVSKTKGSYIQFIDSDDYVDTNYIAHLYQRLTNSRAELAVCAITSYNFKGIKLEEWSVASDVLDFKKIDKKLLITLIETFLLFGPVNKLYLSKIIKDHSILFDTSLSYGEDLLFNFEYFKHIDSIAITDQIAYKYIHDNEVSLSKKEYSNKIEIANRIHFALVDFFKRLKITDHDTMSVLYHRIFDYYYNEAFFIVNQENLTINIKYQKLKSLLGDNELKKSFKFIENKKYPTWIIFLMKNKLSLSFLIVNSIIKKLK